jgi:invasion protein IalB
MKNILKFITVFVAATGIYSSSVLAAPKFIATGWQVVCKQPDPKKALTCEMGNMVHNNGRQTLLTLSIVKNETSAFNISLQLPHGLDIPYGAKLDVDGKQILSLPIKTSQSNGAHTSETLSYTNLNTMKKGNTLNVVFRGTNKSNITVPVSLSGFSKAFDKL